MSSRSELLGYISKMPRENESSLWLIHIYSSSKKTKKNVIVWFAGRTIATVCVSQLRRNTMNFMNSLPKADQSHFQFYSKMMIHASNASEFGTRVAEEGDLQALLCVVQHHFTLFESLICTFTV